MTNTKSLLLILVLGCCIIQASGQALPDYSLRLKSGKMDVPANLETYKSQGMVAEEEELEGHFYRYLQFYQLPDTDQHRAIAAAGIQLLNYLPSYTYIAALPTDISTDQLEALGVRSLLAIPANHKMDATLQLGAFPSYAVEREQVSLIFKYYRNIPHANILDYCAADKLEVLAENGQNNFLRIRVAKDRVPALTDLPYLAYCEIVPEPGIPEDTRGRALHRANAIDVAFPSGRHYNGTGVSVLTRDDGVIGPHIDFHGRLTQFALGDGGIQHADGVSGIFAGAGNLNPAFKGMASGADLYVIDYAADFLDNTLDLHLDNGILVTNSSYSNGCNAGYTTITETVDQQIYENPTLLHVFSAGNSNNQDCGYGAGNQWANITGGHKQGKNVIAAANLFADYGLVNSSSRGPAYDGRIKPDIAAHGQDQISTDPNNNYSGFGGTSAASPGIAGVTAMLHQAYAEANDGIVAPSALLKACMLNTANDMGNPGPDFKFGWGHVNALRAAQTIEEERWLEASIDMNGENEHSITVPAGVQELRIMTYWPDRESMPTAIKALIADLNTEVSGPDGSIYLPWVLNPTPDPALLDLPATTGIDALNNVEQVVVSNPEAGTYSLLVSGFELPFGMQNYYVVYEFRMDEITLIYPIGREGFVPLSDERLYWDAQGDQGTFDLEYSQDSGGSWQFIAQIPGSARHYDWTVNPGLTGHAHLRISRDGVSHFNEEPFSVIDIPGNLNVSDACPDYIRLNWEAVAGADSYEVFRLGDKYMESAGTTTELYFDVPTLNGNPTLEYWLAVRALGDDNVEGRRSVAILYNDGLNNCNLTADVGILNLITPGLSSFTGCEGLEEFVTLEVRNNGMQNEPNVTVGYQLDDEPPVFGTLDAPLAPGASVIYQFGDPLTLDAGVHELVTWVFIANDEAYFNDTVSNNFTAIIFPGQGEAIGSTETFEGTIPPDYWQILNPENNYTWEPFSGLNGPNGGTTTAMFIDNYFYSNSGEEDVLVSIPFDLSEAGSDTYLTFDLAYAPYNLTQYYDELRVDIYTSCGNEFAGTIYQKAGNADLPTAPAQTSVFEPDGAEDWRKEIISLADFAGESVVFHFVNITGYGNSLYLDNVNVSNLVPPTAGFNANALEVCQGEAVIFTDESEGEGLAYNWNFGTGAVPSSANTQGPHIVTYTESGLQTVILEVSNSLGDASQQLEINVLPLPQPGFSLVDNGNGSISFTNSSLNADSYSWDFGDGSTSTEVDPEHQFANTGIYEVTLTVSNACGTETTDQTVNVTVTGIQELSGQVHTDLSPNPNTGSFQLTVSGLTAGDLELRILDVNGRLLEQQTLYPAGGRFETTIDRPGMVSGIYFLQIKTEAGSRMIRFVVDK